MTCVEFVQMLAMGLSTADYGVVLTYLVALIAIGLWANKAEATTETYLLGGRRMPWWAVGISYTVTFLSAISLVGVPGEAYKNGVTAAMWPLLGLCLSVIFFLVFIRFYFQGQVFTPFSYLEQRFGPRSRAVSAGIYCLARLFYLGAVLFATAKVFQGMVGWSILFTILLVGAVSAVYTTLGGMRAVVWTDLMQFVVLVCGLGVVITVAVQKTPGGVLDVIHFARDSNHLFPDFKQPEFYSLSPFARLTLWTLILRAIGDHLFYKTADQVLIQRMLATSSYRHAFHCTILGSALAAIMVLLLYYVGLCIFQFYSSLPVEERPSPDIALFQFIANQLPVPLPGLVVAAVLAAAMSTIDSALNSLSTVVTKDFYLRFWNQNATEAQQIRVSKHLTTLWGVAIVALAALIATLAERTSGTVLESAGIWMSLLLVLGPIFALGALSRRAREQHALLALIVGVTTTSGMIAWYYWMQSQGRPVGFHTVAVTGFLITLLAGFVGSRFTPRQPERQLVNLTLWTLNKATGPSVSEITPEVEALRS